MTKDILSPTLGHAERAYVFAIAMKYVKNDMEAEDIAQEALLLAHRHRATFAGRSRYSTWLYRVAASAALMYLRAKKRRHQSICLSPGTDMKEAFDGAPSPLDIASAREELDATADAAALLSPKYREVFEMRFAHGKTDREVATALGLTITSAKTRACRARAQVRERLHQLGVEALSEQSHNT